MQQKFIITAAKSMWWILIGMHLGALVCVLWVPIFVWVKIGCVVLCGISLYVNLWRFFGANNPKRASELKLGSDATWIVSNQFGEILYSGSITHIFCSGLLIVLTIKPTLLTAKRNILQYRPKHLVITKDSMSSDEFRRLKVMLK